MAAAALWVRRRGLLVRLFVPLHARAFAAVWAGQTLSGLGDRVYTVVLPFVVLGLGGGAGALSVVLTAFSVAQVAALVVAGVVVDRYSRGTVMLAADLVRAAAVGLVAVFLATGGLTVVGVAAAAVVLGLASAFFLPAYTAVIPELVDQDVLPAANSLRGVSMQVAGIGGPLLAGVLVASGGTALAAGANAASFAAAALALLLGARPLLTARRPARTSSAAASEPGHGTGWWRSIRAGLAVVAGHTWLWVSLALFGVLNICFAGGVSLVLPLLAASRWGGARGYALLLTAFAVGSLIGAVAIGARRLRRPGRAIYLLMAAAGVSLSGAAGSRSLATAAGCVAVAGACIAAFAVLWETLLQQRVPSHLLGRVASLDHLASVGLLPVGWAAVGLLVAATSPAVALTALGVLVSVLALAALSIPSVRNLEGTRSG